MFLNDKDTLIYDETTAPYLAAMPGGANLCLNYIASSVRHLVKFIEIEHDGQNKKYNLKDLAPDFYAFEKVYYGDNLERTYDFRLIADDALYLGNKAGKYTCFYNAYAPPITKDTSNDYELPLYREVAGLLPWFMASQLYKEDDPSLSGVYWNEFVTMLEDVRYSFLRNNGFEDEFVDKKGWWS